MLEGLDPANGNPVLPLISYRRGFSWRNSLGVIPFILLKKAGERGDFGKMELVGELGDTHRGLEKIPNKT